MPSDSYAEQCSPVRAARLTQRLRRVDSPRCALSATTGASRLVVVATLSSAVRHGGAGARGCRRLRARLPPSSDRRRRACRKGVAGRWRRAGEFREKRASRHRRKAETKIARTSLRTFGRERRRVRTSWCISLRAFQRPEDIRGAFHAHREPEPRFEGDEGHRTSSPCASRSSRR